MAKEPIVHRDILGRVLTVGDHIAYPDANQLKIGRVDKLNPKMIRVSTGNQWRGTVNKYPSDLTKLEGPELMWYLLNKD